MPGHTGENKQPTEQGQAAKNRPEFPSPVHPLVQGSRWAAGTAYQIRAGGQEFELGDWAYETDWQGGDARGDAAGRSQIMPQVAAVN